MISGQCGKLQTCSNYPVHDSSSSRSTNPRRDSTVATRASHRFREQDIKSPLVVSEKESVKQGRMRGLPSNTSHLTATAVKKIEEVRALGQPAVENLLHDCSVFLHARWHSCFGPGIPKTVKIGR